jgi:ABC-type transport system substrate-binding protein
MRSTFAVLLISLLMTAVLGAQGRATQAPVSTARAAAPIDLTGNWVSVVTQGWRWRMVTPAKGDYASIPITLEAKKAGDNWDPARDEAAGEQCKSYGAAALMAVPTRLRITWQDANTLKIETDAGTQTRLFYFGEKRPQRGAPTWQGDSVAQWERPRAGRGLASKGGSLKVVTTHLRPGYLRKNGVPYSADAVLTEYWDVSADPNGDQWITLTSTVQDDKYLREPWVTALNFKKERDGGKWDPTPCSSR